MNRQWVGAAILGLAACTACGGGDAREAGKSAASQAAQEAKSDARNAVRVTGDLQNKWGIGLARAERTRVDGAIVVPGVLNLDPRRTAQISSLLDGKVLFVGAQVGDEVRLNQALVTVHAPSLAQAKTAYLQAGARLELARREFERAEKLLQQEAIDQKEHLRRRTDLDGASSELAAAESNLHSYGLDQAAVDQLLQQARGPAPRAAAMDNLADPYLTLTSPIAGRVIERDVVNGQHVEPQKTLFTISDLSTLWALLDARESDLPHVARGQRVRVTTTIYPDRGWDGVVDHVGDVVDEKTRTVKLRVVLRNDGRLLKPNMYVQGELAGALRAQDLLTVPQDAIQTIAGEPVIFVRQGSDLFEARPVELGDRVGARRAVLRGLDGSESVVVAGGFNLKAELLKSTLAGE